MGLFYLLGIIAVNTFPEMDASIIQAPTNHLDLLAM